MTLGQRIQELRKQNNLSQEALGEKLGVSRQAISRWEMDGAVPEVDKLIAMGRLFGVDLNSLLQVAQPGPAGEGEAPDPVPEGEGEAPGPAPEGDGPLHPVNWWKWLPPILALLALVLGLVALTLSFGRITGKLSDRLTALESRVEELLAGGVPAACAVPATPQKRPQNSGTRRENRQAVPADAGNPPWEEERPPLPEEPGEPGERVLLSGEPPAKLVEQPKEINYPQEQAVSGETLWPGLVTGIRGKFPAEYPFLSNPASVQGRIEDGVLTLWVIDEFIKDMVGKASILEELARLASTQVGKPVRCTVKVGKAPAEQAASQQKHDNLDDLLALGRQFDNIIIEE